MACPICLRIFTNELLDVVVRRAVRRGLRGSHDVEITRVVG